MNSKNIGNQYEREFSYKLSEWITGEKGSDICWRDVNSGNRKTIREKKGLDTSRKADIICTDSQYEYFFKLFYIDSKSYKNFNWCFINKKNQKSNTILNEWKKTVNECPEKMIPFMPVKIRDRITPELLFLPKYCFISNFLNYIFIDLKNDYSCYLVLWEDFIKSETSSQFYEKNFSYIQNKYK